jgi:hypothetical protein
MAIQPSVSLVIASTMLMDTDPARFLRPGLDDPTPKLGSPPAYAERSHGHRRNGGIVSFLPGRFDSNTNQSNHAW